MRRLQCCCSPEWSFVAHRGFHRYRSPFYRNTFHVFLSDPVLMLWSSTFFALLARHHHALGDCVKLPGDFFWKLLVDLPLWNSFFVFTSKRKSSQRSSNGRADAILNDKIRNEKKKNCDCSWTLTGKNWKFQSPNVGRNRIAKTEREFLFQPVGKENGEFFRRSSACSGKFPVELRVPFAFKPVEPEICLNGKRPRCPS